MKPYLYEVIVDKGLKFISMEAGWYQCYLPSYLHSLVLTIDIHQACPECLYILYCSEF